MGDLTQSVYASNAYAVTGESTSTLMFDETSLLESRE